jgi:CRISPR-associated protein Csd1
MILQALHDYYRRRCSDPDPAHRLPAFGLEQKEIAFVLELDQAGALKAVTDTRQLIGKKKIGASYLVPKGVKKTSGIAANLLWDSAEYVLGTTDAKKLDAARAKNGEADYRQRLVDMRAAFRQRIETLPDVARADAGIQAVLAFLAGEPATVAAVFEAFADIQATNPVLSFRLVTDTELICQRPGVAPHLVTVGSSDDGEEEAAPSTQGLCLVTGDQAPVARLHTAIKGVWGAQTSGANIVSFNLDAFNSRGKAQGGNAPVGQAAAFAYTTALNALLARDSRQRMQVGDASTVFWAQRAGEPIEDDLADLFGGDNPDRHAEQVRSLYEAIHKGAFAGERGENKFFVLGLAPNAARISIRFWHACRLKDLAPRIAAWFDDLQLQGGPNDPRYPSLFRVLTAIALQGKADNIPPRLGGDLVRCIFEGTAYPVSWLQAAVQRCRAEQQVTYLRAASIKACLRRLDRSASSNTPTFREIQPVLDTANPSTAYRLGRLFATLEKIQEEASPGLNATIRERYYGAASSTPVAVFTTLMRLKNHHLAKLTNRGRATNFEQLLAEIIGGIDDFPSHLALAEQGRFAIGYYHQRQDFFAKREGAAADASA